jgi:Asp-tRNA(Asn)/Glu-tRNA(Gln) amidotransferase C subunit
MLKHLKEYNEFEYSQEIGLNEGFLGDIKDIWNSFMKLVEKILKEKKAEQKTRVSSVKKASPLEGQHMLYLPHQQGPSGAVKLVDVYRGKKKLDPNDRTKLLKNMPSSDPGYQKVLKGNDREAVTAFLNYQKNTWGNYQKEALSKIKLPENKAVKKAIDKLLNPNFPKEFLTTVAYKESRFVPNPPTNKTYRGLFQIGPSAWAQLKRINPEKYKGSLPPIDPIKNTQAGHDYLKWTYEQFEKDVRV